MLLLLLVLKILYLGKLTVNLRSIGRNISKRFCNFIWLWDSLPIHFHFLILVTGLVYKYDYTSILFNVAEFFPPFFTWLQFWPVWWWALAYFAVAMWVCWDAAYFWDAKFPGSYIKVINNIFGQRRSTSIQIPNKLLSVCLTVIAIQLNVFLYNSRKKCIETGYNLANSSKIYFFDLPDWLQDVIIYLNEIVYPIRVVLIFTLRGLTEGGFFDFKLDVFFLIVFLVFILFTVSSPLHTLITLIAVFVHSAMLLFWIHVEFFSSTILIVYVGAISILFLFVIILLNIREEPQFDTRLTIIIPVVCVLLFISSQGTNDPLSFYVEADQPISTMGTLAELSNKFGSLPAATFSDVMTLNLYLYTKYSLWFFCAAWLLFVTMVGSIAVLSIA